MRMVGVCAALVAVASVAVAQDNKEIHAKVASVRGSAEYKELGKDASWKKLTPGLTLRAGTYVHTGLKSRVVLVFDNATTVTIKSSSLAVITESLWKGSGYRAEIKVDLGRIRVDVDESRKKAPLDFKVTTPQGTCSIRGSSAEVSCYSDVNSTVQKFHGDVSASNARGQTMDLADGSEVMLDNLVQVSGEGMPVYSSTYDNSTATTNDGSTTTTSSTNQTTMATNNTAFETTSGGGGATTTTTGGGGGGTTTGETINWGNCILIFDPLTNTWQRQCVQN